MKKLILSMSLLVAVCCGSVVQAQGLGSAFRAQGPQDSAQDDIQLQQARLQQVNELQRQLQDGTPQQQSARVPGPGEGAGQIPGQGQIQEQGPLPGQGPAGAIPAEQQPALNQGLAPRATIQENAIIEGGAVVQEGGPDVVVEERVDVAVQLGAQKLSIGAVVEPVPGVGLKVIDVIPGSQANAIGMLPGMLIKKVNLIPVSSAEQLEALLLQAIELRHGRVEILVRNVAYDGYHVPEFAVLELRLLRAYRPVVIEEYEDYGHYDEIRYHYNYRPRRIYGGGGGGCSRY